MVRIVMLVIMRIVPVVEIYAGLQIEIEPHDIPALEGSFRIYVEDTLWDRPVQS